MLRTFANSRAVRIVFLLFVLYAASTNGAEATGGSSRESLLCNVELPSDAGGNLNRGDRLFRRQKYRLAAAAYYQALFCGRLTMLYPAVFDHPSVVNGCKAALRLAYSGHDLEAANRFRKLKQQLPGFTEAGAFAGDYFWAAGDGDAAKRMWRQTIDGPNFPLPEDLPDPSQSSAREMLEWTKLRR